MAKALAAHDITPIQFTILYFVDYDKGELSSAQLSRRFSMTPQSMNELVTVLEKKMLLKKVIDPAHRRILRIGLTSKGKRLLEDCSIILDAVEEALLKRLSDNEKSTFRKAIGKILETSREDAQQGD